MRDEDFAQWVFSNSNPPIVNRKAPGVSQFLLIFRKVASSHAFLSFPGVPRIEIMSIRKVASLRTSLNSADVSPDRATLDPYESY
jgi:hypothetical protein